MTGAIIAAIIIAVIIFLLSVPLDFRFRLEVNGRFKFRFILVWLFGLVKKEFGRGKKKPQQAGRKTGRGWSFLDFVRIGGLPGRLLRLIRDIFKSIRIKMLEVDFDVSLGDPADTAPFVGALWLPTFIMRPSFPYQVSIRPLYSDELYLQGHAYADIRLYPIQLIPALVRFGFSRPGRRLVGMFLFGRWKRKK